MGNSGSAVKIRQCVAAMVQASYINSEEMWLSLLEEPQAAQDIFENIHPETVRLLLQKAPHNLAHLILKCVATIDDVCENVNPARYNQALNSARILTRILPFLFEAAAADLVPAPTPAQQQQKAEPKAAETPSAKTDDVVSSATAVEATKETTVDGDTELVKKEEQASDVAAATEASITVDAIPISPALQVAQSSAQARRFIEQVFWKQGGAYRLATSKIGDRESLKKAMPELKTDSEERIIGEMLVHSVVRLLFLPDFTVSPEQFMRAAKQGDNSEANSTNTNILLHLPNGHTASINKHLLWWGGVGTTEQVHPNARYDANRVEILKLLITLLSSTLYETPQSFQEARKTAKPDQYANLFVSVLAAKSCPLAPALCLSLLNVSVSYDPYGWGIPYTGILTDPREELINTALQVLLLLLDADACHEVIMNSESDENNDAGIKQGTLEQKGGDVDEDEETGKPVNEPKTAYVRSNIYTDILISLKSTSDFAFLCGGLCRLLSNSSYEAESSYIPNGYKKVLCHQELLILLWKLLSLNKDFLLHLLRFEDITTLVGPILYFAYLGRNDPARVGLVHICSFILLLLSGERNFAVALNKPYTLNLALPDIPLFSGTYADLVIIVLQRIIVSGSKELNGLRNCLLTVIANISPYCKMLCLVSATKLCNLFKIFSAPKYLAASPNNFQFTKILLEVFNNLIQYQYEGNHQLVYVLLRRKELFEKIENLSLTDFEIKASRKLEETQTAKNAQAADDVNIPGIVSEEWLAQIKTQLPSQTLSRLIQNLHPQVVRMCQNFNSSGETAHEAGVMQFLKNSTLVGLLPVPHPIVIHRYQPNEYTKVWFSTFLWGVIFLRNQHMPLFDGRTIRLFAINMV